MFAQNKHINAVNLVKKITGLKKNPQFSFLDGNSNDV